MHRVVGLGAWCEFVPEGESGASPGSVSFQIDEFAVLADGRRVQLHHGERGYALWGPRDRVDHPLGDLTAEAIEQNTLMTVLPDDDDGEPHPWPWLAELLLAQGLRVAPEELRTLPYEVVLGDVVRNLLATRSPELSG